MTANTVAARPQRWWAAALFNLLSWLGVGYLYVRHPGRALIATALNILLLAALWHGLDGLFAVPAIMIALMVIWTLLAIVFAVDGARLAKHANASPARWYNRWWVYLALIAGGLALALVVDIKDSIRSFVIPAASMEPTLRVGERFFVDMRAYERRGPARGDVVIFLLPRDRSVTYVKRVVGLPGDEVQVKGGALYLNGAALPTEAVGEYVHTAPGGAGPIRSGKLIRETIGPGRSAVVIDTIDSSAYDNTTTFKVPADQYFMLGDNRDNSLDSREQSARFGVGYVPRANILGKPAWIYWSAEWSRIGTRID